MWHLDLALELLQGRGHPPWGGWAEEGRELQMLLLA